MLFALVEFAADAGFWTVCKAYYFGKWVIYGTPEDQREKYIQEQREIIEAYKEQLEQLKRETDILKEFVEIEVPTLSETEEGDVEGETVEE